MRKPASGKLLSTQNQILGKRYSGIQPQYFPRLHYFARILNTDTFVIRDDAQYVRKHKYPDGRTDKSYQAHTQIKQSSGVQLLAIPTKHEGFLPLAETKISHDNNWAEEHLKTLQYAYNKAINFNKLFPEIKEMLLSNFDNLADLNNATIFWGILKLLGKEDVKAADLSIKNVNEELKKQKNFRLKEIKRATETSSFSNLHTLSANEKIIALCNEVGANEDYCGGTGAAAYMDAAIFGDNGIKITVQDWKCEPYPQLFNKHQPFLPNLSILDLLMNVPTKEAIKIIS